MSISDQELLRLGAAARGPAPGEPTRCILFNKSQTIVNSGAFAVRKTSDR
jgi:hypothetical protein